MGMVKFIFHDILLVMAYMSQAHKAQIAPVVKSVLKRFGITGTLSVRNHSTLVLTISEGPIDFIGNTMAVREQGGRRMSPFVRETYLDVNPYWYHEHFDGVAKEFLGQVLAAMNVGNHDHSNAQIDHFDVGWYVDINVGRWNKPYRLRS